MDGTPFFLLTADARDDGGQCLIRLWGLTPSGSALVEIPRHRPVFFLSSTFEDSQGLLNDLVDQRRSLDLKSFDGRPVDALYFRSLAASREARRRLSEVGQRLFESDIRAEDRWVMERFITGSAVVEGASELRRGGQVWTNPRLTSSDWRPKLSTFSLDIETGQDGRLYSLAFHVDHGGRDWDGPHVEGVAVLAPGEASPYRDFPGFGPRPVLVPNEADLLRYLMDAITAVDPDVLIGWHVVGFDLSFLDRKARSLGIPLLLGRGHRPLSLFERPGSLPIADLEGRLVIDGPPALRGAFHKFPDWRLDTVAQVLLNRGKDIQEHGRDKVAEIERRFREDKEALARYNLEDALLVTEIFRKTGVIEQLVTRSLITGLPVDQVHRSVAAFDRFFLPRLHRKGYVAPDASDVASEGSAPGAMVFTSGVGIHEDVAVLDFKSLYPTVIRTFHIDPYSALLSDEHPLETPVGIRFSRSEHILPSFLSELMERRAEAKSAGDAPLAQAVKILMNSMYGVMGSPGCRFYRHDLPTAITGIGRWVLETTSKKLKEWGYDVLYGDTDSVFVRLKQEDRNDPDSAGRRLALRVDGYFQDFIRKEYGVPSRLELEYEKRYLRLFLPAMRGTGEAAVKRYAGLLPDNTVEIKGMEYVRSDSTDLARDFQYELLRRTFAGEDLRIWIKDMVSRIRDGEFDEKLVYRRRLSRPAKAYKSPPPHVRAVLMLDPDGKKDLREVEYLITPDGPVPLQLEPGVIDYNHYIEKQIKPLADDVLGLRGESFDALVGGEQLDLF